MPIYFGRNGEGLGYRKFGVKAREDGAGGTGEDLRGDYLLLVSLDRQEPLAGISNAIRNASLRASIFSGESVPI